MKSYAITLRLSKSYMWDLLIVVIKIKWKIVKSNREKNGLYLNELAYLKVFFNLIFISSYNIFG